MDRSNNHTRFYNKFHICLYTVTGILLLTLAGSTKGKAQQAPSNTNIAGPSASATGSVTNQAVQVLQGPYSTNSYGGGVACQGPTMSLAPFVLGNTNFSRDPEAFQSYTANGGFTLGFNFPLDNSLQEICKERARVEIKRQNAEADKARLDFELVRLLKCGEALKAGISFSSLSPYAKVCEDVVVRYPTPINTTLPLQQSNGKVIKQR